MYSNKVEDIKRAIEEELFTIDTQIEYMKNEHIYDSGMMGNFTFTKHTLLRVYHYICGLE